MSAERLADTLDQQRDDERRQALRALLRHALLTRSAPDPGAFALARKHAGWLRDWFARETGWSLYADSGVIRLRKLPGRHADSTRGAAGAKAAFSRRRYVLTCLALAALERAEPQVTLGWLVERVVAFAADPQLAAAGMTFTLEGRDERGDLAAVARLLLSVGVLAKVAGDEQEFVKGTGDALYDVDRRVLATLLVARRGPSTVEATDFAERLREITLDARVETDDARNRVVRHRLARQLLDDPVLYLADLSEEERAYLSSQRGLLLRRLTDGTGFVAEVRAEGIALIDPTGEATDFGMPEEGTDGHVTLLLAEHLATVLRAQPGVSVSVEKLQRQVAELARRHRTHWRKDATAPGAERELTAQALHRLDALGLIRLQGDAVLPLPALARYAYAEPTIAGEPTP